MGASDRRLPQSHPDRSAQKMRFGAFRLDVRAGLLYRGMQPVPLRPKTWAVLVYLAERPGALVTRDELLDAVWPDVAVTPDTLTKSISELRQVLGDDPNVPRVIATVHRRGFRFVAAAERTPVVWQAVDIRRQPFVGRDAELQRLGAHYRAAAEGTRQVVFVTGPAGVGKTTLCQVFLERLVAEDGGAPWIGRAGCLEQHGIREPYMPVLSALDRMARRADGERLIALLRRVAPTWLAQMPWLLGDEEAALRATLQAPRSERMLRELAILLEALTSEVPLVLLLEDLHWSDPATVDLLTKLASRDERARLLVIGTFRPEEVPRRPRSPRRRQRRRPLLPTRRRRRRARRPLGDCRGTLRGAGACPAFSPSGAPRRRTAQRRAVCLRAGLRDHHARQVTGGPGGRGEAARLLAAGVRDVPQDPASVALREARALLEEWSG